MLKLNPKHLTKNSIDFWRTFKGFGKELNNFGYEFSRVIAWIVSKRVLKVFVKNWIDLLKIELIFKRISNFHKESDWFPIEFGRIWESLNWFPKALVGIRFISERFGKTIWCICKWILKNVPKWNWFVKEFHRIWEGIWLTSTWFLKV